MFNSVFKAKKIYTATFAILFLFLTVSMAKASFTLEDEKKLGRNFMKN